MISKRTENYIFKKIAEKKRLYSFYAQKQKSAIPHDKMERKTYEELIREIKQNEKKLRNTP